MNEVADAPQPVITHAVGPDRLDRFAEQRFYRWSRLVLLAVLVLVGVSAVLQGERGSSLSRLESDIAAGRTSTVTVIGATVPAEATGCGQQQLHWRSGLWGWSTDVVSASTPEQARQCGATLADVVLTQDAGVALVAEHPQLTVTRRSTPAQSGGLGSWRVPGSTALAGGIAMLAALVLLVVGPKPWRATRWAWFWLITNPIGAVAFLVLSGPTPGVPRPKDLRRRLTGGWAFLLSVVVAVLVGWRI